MKILELLPVDEYYQTIATWMKIQEDRSKANGGDEGKKPDAEGTTRRKMGAKK